MELEGPVPWDPSRHVVAGFDCGSPSQSAWLRQIARQAQLADTARVYVIADATGRVVGYHALAATAIAPADAPSRLLRRAGRGPIPAILLARLGVDVSAQGLGLGAALLKDAMLRAYRASRSIGARPLLIHAESDAARGFYLHLAEFQASPTDPLHLILPMATIGQIVDGLSGPAGPTA